MQREYIYVHTPEHIGMGEAMRALATAVHEQNEQSKRAVEEEFEVARKEQHRIRARLRKQQQRDRDELLYGKRKRPKQAGEDRTPTTGAGGPIVRRKARTGAAAFGAASAE